jgi:hypothetical protein
MDIAMKKRASEISAGWLSSWSGARFTAAVCYFATSLRYKENSNSSEASWLECASAQWQVHGLQGCAMQEIYQNPASVAACVSRHKPSFATFDHQ